MLVAKRRPSNERDLLAAAELDSRLEQLGCLKDRNNRKVKIYWDWKKPVTAILMYIIEDCTQLKNPCLKTKMSQPLG